MTDQLSEKHTPQTATWRQQRIVDQLYRETRSDHRERVETHISTILLLGDYAYKIKKPVCLNFVDYTTLEARHFFCEEEVRLNRRFAPNLYLACVPICGSFARPVLEGNGKPIEYAVKMKRFEREFQGDVLVRSGTLNSETINSLADTIARFHSEAPCQGGWLHEELISGISSSVLENVLDLQRLFSRGSAAQQRACADIVIWTDKCLRDLKSAFSKRVVLGFVRECHGDLHLSNLVKSKSQWIAFDCIEFNPRLRWIDVMSDLAFPVMDLVANQVPNLAYRLLNRYLEVTGDYAGLKVLRFYLVYRALIRSKVMALRTSPRRLAPRHRLSGRQGAELDQGASQYLNEASQWARPRAPVGLIITHGISGSGKSFASQWIADRFGYIRIRSDVERKRLHGIAIEEKSGSRLRSGIYTQRDDRNTYQRLLDLAECTLTSGWPLILDATFLKKGQRVAARRLAERLQCPFSILVMAAEVEVMRKRLQRRCSLDASEAGIEVMEAQLACYEPLAPNERLDAIETESDPQALVVAVKRIETGWQSVQ